MMLFISVMFNFENVRVVHLGHLLSFDLNDRIDIFRVIKDVKRKANLMLNTLRHVDPFVLAYLLR